MRRWDIITQLPDSETRDFFPGLICNRADPPDGPRPMVLSDLWAPRSVRTTLSSRGTTIRACGLSQPWRRHLSLVALPSHQEGRADLLSPKWQHLSPVALLPPLCPSFRSW
jgi:hypothetical protein